MNKNYSFIYEGKSYSGLYSLGNNGGKTMIHDICPALSEHIPDGFYFVIKSDGSFTFNPRLTVITDEIAEKIFFAIQLIEGL